MNPATRSRPSRTRTSRIIIGPSPAPRARRKPWLRRGAPCR
jgi:hypothetical protein